MLNIRSISASLLLSTVLGSAAGAVAQNAVGTYYYPWWGESIGGHTFDQSLRARTEPVAHLPTLGKYNNFDQWTLASHIDQSQAANVSMWSVSWWGPNGFEDRVLRQAILTHPHASRLKYTVHYETSGRLGDPSSPNYSRFNADLDYLAANVLNDPNYMRIDGKPVLFVYLSRVYFNEPGEVAQLQAARQTLLNNRGVELYIAGDHVFNQTAGQGSALDAVTVFDVYGQIAGQGRGTTTAGVTDLTDTYAAAKALADGTNANDFIPTVSPGYNDRGVRLEADNNGAPRYYEDFGGLDTAGKPFEHQILFSAVPHADPDTGGLIMVNSFNEWHEDTQIEITPVSPFTNQDDTPNNELTEGKFYEGYGTKYLDILRRATGGAQDYVIFNGLVGDGNQDGVLDLADVQALITHFGQDSSVLTLREIALHGDWTLDGITNADDVVMLVGLLNDAGVAVQVDDVFQQIDAGGDFNLNGSVEQGDLDLVLNNWGGDNLPLNWLGSFGFDGRVDQNELDAVLNQWGTSASPSAFAPIPEPSVSISATLLLIGIGRRRSGRYGTVRGSQSRLALEVRI